MNSETVLVFLFRSRGVAFVAFVGGVVVVDVDACACEGAEEEEEEEEEEEGDANPSLREKKSRIFPWWWWRWWCSPLSRPSLGWLLPPEAMGASAGADGVPDNSELLLVGPNSSSIWLLGQRGCEGKVEWVMNHVRERKETVGGSHPELEAAW